jgi:CheY-like chemotaxis protein
MSSEELQRSGIATCLAKSVKQSRLFDCLINHVDLLVTESPSPKAAETQSTSSSLGLDKPLLTRILLAEDNIINQRIALDQLRKLGYKADAVANGFEVLEALERIPYAVIIMDCQMPEMDGYLATLEIRKRERDLAGGHTQKLSLHYRHDRRRRKCQCREVSNYRDERLPQQTGPTFRARNGSGALESRGRRKRRKSWRP